MATSAERRELQTRWSRVFSLGCECGREGRVGHAYLWKGWCRASGKNGCRRVINLRRWMRRTLLRAQWSLLVELKGVVGGVRGWIFTLPLCDALVWIFELISPLEEIKLMLLVWQTYFYSNTLIFETKKLTQWIRIFSKLRRILNLVLDLNCLVLRKVWNKLFKRKFVIFNNSNARMLIN